MKKCISMLLTISFCLNLLMFPGMAVEQNALPEITQNSPVITNNTTSLDTEEIELIWAFVQGMIEQRYGNLYDFENYDVEFSNECATENDTTVDVDIVVDMISTCRPEDSQYFAGYADGIAALDEETSAVAQSLYDAEYAFAEEDYGKPNSTGIVLQVHFPTERPLNTETMELYWREEITPTEIDISEFNATPIGNDTDEWDAGVDAAEAAEAMCISDSVYAAKSTTYYYINKAVNYALQHGTDKPEYNEDNGGSDCANFLSYCLNAGGIPKSSKWKPKQPNWIRTGANGNGGVAPYMESKKYFWGGAKIKNAIKGCFLYWNGTPYKSHVAIITYKSGETIKITDHSSTQRKKSQVNRLIKSDEKKGATVYYPYAYKTS